MSVLIIIPLYNEADSVRRVLCAVERFSPPEADVLVVNDGSTDLSAAVLADFPHVKVIDHMENLGYGAALIHGFEVAIEKAYHAAITMDCDEQHEPHLIPRFLDELERADIVSGSRYMKGSDRGQDAPLDRLSIGRFITQKVNDLSGLNLTDAFCGFKAYRTTALCKLHLDEPSYGMPLQLWIQAARLGLRVREIPVGRIYKNHSRRFNGELDDPRIRRHYYLDVLAKETEKWRKMSSC